MTLDFSLLLNLILWKCWKYVDFSRYWDAKCKYVSKICIFPYCFGTDVTYFPKGFSNIFFFILQYCIEGLVSWVITLTWKVFRPNFVQKFKMHFFNNQKNPTELPFNSDQFPSQRSVNFKMFFGCHCLDQNTSKIFSGFLP